MNKTSSSVVHFEYTGERYVPKDVTHVQFHPAVTQIEDYAFEDCTKLRQVILNEGLVKIGNNAFHECRVLSSIILPSSVVEIGTYVFYNCYRLLEVELNEGLQKIGFQAFANCNVLQSIHLPSTLTEIDQYAFQKCSSLRAVMLNEGLQKLGKGAFDSCTALERVTFSSTIKEVEDYSFKGCGQLREIVLIEGIKMIKKGAFQECTSLETVSLPSTLEKIGNAAFCNCSGLKKMLFHGNGELCSIGFYAFKDCTALERFVFSGISTRLKNIIKAGQSHLDSKISSLCSGPDRIRAGGLVVRRSGSEIFVFSQDLAPVTGNINGVLRRDTSSEPAMSLTSGRFNWIHVRDSLEKIDRLITHYEFKEATVLFELALWKAGIDRADDTSPSERAACRIEVPGPVKDAIMQYFSFS